MRADAWLSQATRQLADAGISTARLDALILLEDATGKSRAWLLAHPEFALSDKQHTDLLGKIARRATHEPLSYIRNRTEFYGRSFYIDAHVLEPRPESETMIELLKARVQNGTIIDVGTGSGALGLTAKLEIPASHVTLIDIDLGCLAVARKNQELLQADATIQAGNLLDTVSSKQPIAALLCNLPYVPDDYHINTAATNEPRLAIFGGADGLDLYRVLFEQARTLRPDYIFTESLPPQHQTLQHIAAQQGFELQATDDFIQVFILRQGTPGPN